MVIESSTLPPSSPNPLSHVMSCRELPSTTVAVLNSVPQYPLLKKDQDYFLQSDGEIIRVNAKDYEDREDKKYPDAVPLVWEAWLYGPSTDTATLRLGEARVIAATGLKGGGKSETLALLSAKALASGMPVWSNMAVKFYLVRGDGSLELCRTQPLDWNAVLLLSKELRGGALIIDELSYYASSRMSGSVRNRILNAAVNQVRKRALDFYTSVKFLRQIDVNIREELDCQISCEDYALSKHGQSLYLDKGCLVKQRYRDISGWSGSPVRHERRKRTLSIEDDYGMDRLGEPIYKDTGQLMEFDARFTWPIYDSYEVVETADAFRKVRLDLEEIVISDKPQMNEVEHVLGEVVDTFRNQGETKVSCEVFREIALGAGVRLGDKQLGKILKSAFSIGRKRKNAGNYYDIGAEDE